MDTVRRARASLLAPAVLAVAEPEALPSNSPGYEGRFTQAQAASAAGIGEDTLIRWLSKGLIDPPKVKFSKHGWLWTQEDVERIKVFKRTSLDDRRVATGRLTKKQQPLRSASAKQRCTNRFGADGFRRRRTAFGPRRTLSESGQPAESPANSRRGPNEGRRVCTRQHFEPRPGPSGSAA
jgi:hypothetical protein